MRTTKLQQRIFEEFDKGRIDECRAIARDLGVHHSTVYSAREKYDDWKVELKEEQIEREAVGLFKIGYAETWRWPEEHRLQVISALRQIDKLMEIREPDAQPPEGWDRLELLDLIARGDSQQEGDEDDFSVVTLAGNAAERNQ